MNKYQKALSDIYVKSEFEYPGMTDDVGTLVELVNKAEPDKPLYQAPFKSFGKCPSCNVSVNMANHNHFCGACGKALDWSK